MHDFNYDVMMPMEDGADALVPGYGYREPMNESLKETARTHYMGHYSRYYPQLTSFLLDNVDAYRINDIYDIPKKIDESKFFSLVLLEMEDIIINESGDMLLSIYEIMSKCFLNPSPSNSDLFFSEAKQYIYKVVKHEVNSIIEKCYDYIDSCYENTIDAFYTEHSD